MAPHLLKKVTYLFKRQQKKQNKTKTKQQQQQQNKTLFETLHLYSSPKDAVQDVKPFICMVCKIVVVFLQLPS